MGDHGSGGQSTLNQCRRHPRLQETGSGGVTLSLSQKSSPICIISRSQILFGLSAPSDGVDGVESFVFEPAEEIDFPVREGNAVD